MMNLGWRGGSWVSEEKDKAIPGVLASAPYQDGGSLGRGRGIASF